MFSVKETLYENPATNCVHSVVYPGLKGAPYLWKHPSSTQAKRFPFTLDDFQNRAVQCVENNEYVLVSAHTSAGKTVVALYTIAKCLKEGKCVVYTSPTKALGNQKYRELKTEFGDEVGIITGDVSINPTAKCLVMTAEILRNMIYRKYPLSEDLAWVVFDEAHYISDRDRGTIWEETIILLPSEIRLVFLSATISNGWDFCQWISQIKKVPCHFVFTDHRPIPLHYSITTYGICKMFPLVNSGIFDTKNFEITKTYLAFHDLFIERRSIWVSKVVHGLINAKSVPAIVFSGGMRTCTKYASVMESFDLNSIGEQTQVDKVIKESIEGLSEEEKLLPQFQSNFKLLRKGIGVHHAGLLPTLKEIVEILFSQGLIKVLFATETFAMGVNMPARSVVFATCEKFDGQTRRLLTPTEFTHMSGRAGRRGLDDKGQVVLMFDKLDASMEDIKQMVMAAPDDVALRSQFVLNYSTILHLLPGDKSLSVQQLITRSFHQFQNPDSSELNSDFIKRLEVLHHFGYIKSEDKSFRLTEKGLFARQIFSTDQLILTEFIFTKTFCFEELNIVGISSLLSCFVEYCDGIPERRKQRIGTNQSPIITS